MVVENFPLALAIVAPTCWPLMVRVTGAFESHPAPVTRTACPGITVLVLPRLRRAREEPGPVKFDIAELLGPVVPKNGIPVEPKNGTPVGKPLTEKNPGK